AKSIQIRGQALRENPEVLQLEAINKWNGTLPQYMTSGTNTPFIQVK
ncbi:SPFH/Band 7/PHB domain protein, partial [Klebsiella pneumoniae]|nr:SPFH/Band 7/PHB domain protein [Klebsiella pneumoniae]